MASVLNRIKGEALLEADEVKGHAWLLWLIRDNLAQYEEGLGCMILTSLIFSLAVIGDMYVEIYCKNRKQPLYVLPFVDTRCLAMFLSEVSLFHQTILVWED